MKLRGIQGKIAWLSGEIKSHLHVPLHLLLNQIQ